LGETGLFMQNNLNILIAEDEYIVMIGLKSALIDLGYNVVGVANSGEVLVKLAFEKRPDLMIVDINMPKMDGIEAIEQINKRLVIPAIVITGYSKEEFVKRANKAGVLHYLIKPVDEKELKPAIEITMGRFEDFKKMRKEIVKKQEALQDRKLIERAKGIIMDKNGLKEAQAMKALQKKSRDSNKKISEIAKEIIKAEEVLKIDRDLLK